MKNKWVFPISFCFFQKSGSVIIILSNIVQDRPWDKDVFYEPIQSNPIIWKGNNKYDKLNQNPKALVSLHSL